jgi:hypothetical protein
MLIRGGDNPGYSSIPTDDDSMQALEHLEPKMLDREAINQLLDSIPEY